jgi:small subunit ribosomal protein S6|tara:strand:- start:573 stop:920 length:348 start_codon:yes stop_codon:yes gene_type:complete
MNLYEHTIITRPDVSPTQIKQLQDKYIKLVEKFEGNIEKVENWGLLNLSYIIKKNKKGNYIHFKIKGNGKTISELEKNEKLDKSLLRYLTVKVKKFDLNTNYFEKKSDEIKDKSN